MESRSNQTPAWSMISGILSTIIQRIDYLMCTMFTLLQMTTSIASLEAYLIWQGTQMGKTCGRCSNAIKNFTSLFISLYFMFCSQIAQTRLVIFPQMKLTTVTLYYLISSLNTTLNCVSALIIGGSKRGSSRCAPSPPNWDLFFFISI